MSWCGEIRYSIVRTRDKWRAELVYSCVSWADDGSYQCGQWANQLSLQCAQYADDGYQQCSSWADEGSEQCCDWAPCSWFCDAFYWVANWVCQGWYWVSNIVCQAWCWVANAVCQAWFWVAKLVCNVFAYILYWILTIVAYLVWYVLWIPCHIFNPPQPLSGPIQHIFVLVLENRSFDHMLGISTSAAPGETWWANPGVGADAIRHRQTTVNGAQQSANSYNGQGYGVRSGAPFVMPVDPPHEFCDVQLQLASAAISGKPLDDKCQYSGTYPILTMAGFVQSYANEASVEGNAQALADLGAVMACLTQEQVPVISTLACEFAVCDNWYSALPGPTWPNRFFLHAATSGGLDNSPGTWDVIVSQVAGYQFENGTIYDALDSQELPWSVYHGDDLPQILSLAGMDLLRIANNFHDLDDLASDLEGDDFPAYIFIEPNYGNLITHGGNFQCGSSEHPIDDVTRGEALIKQVYETIRSSKYWPSSALVVLYDEHGGFFDHVEPPKAMPPGDIINPANNQHGFRFDQQGVRIPAVVASPWIPKITLPDAKGQNCNIIDHTRYDHGSLLATVERLYGLPSLTQRDATANDFRKLFSAKAPRTDAPLTLPDPADSGYTCQDGTLVYTNPDGAGEMVSRSREERDTDAVTPTVRGFIQNAAILDARLHPDDWEGVRQRAASIRTLGDARLYMSDVSAQVATQVDRLRSRHGKG